MANTKDYAMREMILDRCFSTGKEYTREELMDIVNHVCLSFTFGENSQRVWPCNLSFEKNQINICFFAHLFVSLPR